MLELVEVEVTYGNIPALRGLSLRVAAGRIVALVGANGAGKSTAMRALTGLVPLRSGKILLDGREIQGLPTHAITRLGVAVSPEGRRIFANLSVRENLLLGGYHRRDRRGLATDMAELFELFPRLRQRFDTAAGTLSGGEQQMLAVGRALMSRPRLLLLDEPSLGLAPLLVQDLFGALAAINRRGTTILLVEQNAAVALEVAHYGYVLENGRVVFQGPAADLLTHPRVRAAYLGLEGDGDSSH